MSFLLKVFAVVAFIPLFASAAVDANGNQMVSLTTPFDLNVDQAAISFIIPYPENLDNPKASICNVELRADAGNIRSLLSVVEIQNTAGNPQVVFPSNTVLRLDYSQATEIYDATFTIKTKNGTSLKQAVAAALGAGRRLILLGTACAN